MLICIDNLYKLSHWLRIRSGRVILIYSAWQVILIVLNVSVHIMICDEYCITKTYIYNFDPLKPHFYIVKLGFTGVNIILLISAQNIDCEYSLEPPRRGGSNEYHNLCFEQKDEAILTSTHNLCFEQKCEKYQLFFYLKIFSFLVVKFSVYLNRHVVGMEW